MKKILIITYYWPPSGGSGVQRWVFFSKYLSQFGFEPIVLTVDEKKASYKNTDLSLQEEIKHVRVTKTNTFEPLRFYSFLTTGNSQKGIPQGYVEKNSKGIFYKVSNFVRGNLFFPDARMGWNSYAFTAAKKLIQEEDISIVITTGPPNSTHLIGQKLKKLLPIKWMADFRDPWSDIYYNKDLHRLQRIKNKEIKLEKDILIQADIILTIGSKLKELLYKKINIHPQKFHHIFNGYDSVLMDSIKKNNHDFFIISFIGLLSQNQPYQSIIQSLKLFTNNIKDCKIKLILAGNIQEKILEEFKTKLPSLNIEIKGYLSRLEAIETMKNSQLLINCLAEMENSQILISGKQMEYIATGNPIICFGDKSGESALILKEIPNTNSFEKAETKEAANFIESIYKKWKNNESISNDTNNENIKIKSRFETARQLSELLKSL